ncbi:methyltransferase family protein [Desulfonatronum lacustre]|uniref:methyltransferase family protein n=1 Tax=Desulfonatronum lacustre TaxID=66849 RepID=UPI00048FE9FD|nr:isoprenylcysteine carboxylmethyltransferase family protein [Desulfonatronum lacustre]
MHVGTWGLALIVIVIVSWLLYRYLAPQSWKEWSSAGVIQAFIIAFYAEMYGFPLTIYFLARFFGLDLKLAEGGNLWAQLFGTPVAHIVAMLIGYAIVFSGAILVADGWRRVHQARKEDRLVTDGVYAKVRHPQYTGLFLIVFGEGIVHWPTIVSVIAFPVIVFAYTLLARKEEGWMVEKFGEEYRDYQRSVPMFIPSLKSNDPQEV